MNAYCIDPLADPRWSELLQRHPDASAFHTSGWLEALRRSYGYEPAALTTTPPGRQLENGMVFCRVNSWLTGRRIVSLPFSDHCEPLLQNAEDLDGLLSGLKHETAKSGCRYAELRPISALAGEPAALEVKASFAFHNLDLRPGLDEIMRRVQRDSVARKIRRAEREKLGYKAGRSEPLLRQFYELLLLTRRRHQLPPQPIGWFRNLIACVGDNVTIRVASKDDRPVASILTLRHGNTLVYKYGCSDMDFSNLGGMQMLLWRAVDEGKREGATRLDLGRSDWTNPGLIEFKNRWGAEGSTLTYWKYSRCASSARKGQRWAMHIPKQVIACLPDGILTAASNLIYKHIG